MNSKATATWFRPLGGILSVLLLGAGSPTVLIADQAPAGLCCQEWGPGQRDAKGGFDSCLTTSQSACNNPQWCVILGNIPDSWYCADWPARCPTESTCHGFPVTVNVRDGYCQWGYGNPENPRPKGECFCLYDEQQPPVPITIYDCSS